MHSQNSMPWKRYFGRVTDGIRQERLLSVDSKVLLIWAVQPTNAISKTTVAGVSPLDYIRKQQVSFIEKIDCGICAAALGSESRETARSKMESSTLCLEVPNNGLAIVGEKRCSLALFIRQRSWLAMKCILWQHDRFIYVVFA